MAAKKENYHHGDLRVALLKAGEAVLATTGSHGFSLRQVAREVGVSHSAPAHHFGDANGLLMAMAADGYSRFLQAMQERQVNSKRLAMRLSGISLVILTVCAGFPRSRTMRRWCM